MSQSLVLVPLDENFEDMNGNKYEKNKFLNCENFEKNQDITNGFFGYINGKINEENHNSIDRYTWAVVKCDDNSIIDLKPIFSDKKNNEVKFNSGIIVEVGTLDSCISFFK